MATTKVIVFKNMICELAYFYRFCILLLFQMALVTLSQKEKMFFSLAFFQQKAWFGRQELLQNSFESLRDTFVSIQKHEIRETSFKEVLFFVC